MLYLYWEYGTIILVILDAPRVASWKPMKPRPSEECTELEERTTPV